MPSMRQSYTVTVPEEPPAAAFPFLKQEMRRKGSMSGSMLVSTFVGLLINQAKRDRSEQAVLLFTLSRWYGIQSAVGIVRCQVDPGILLPGQPKYQPMARGQAGVNKSKAAIFGNRPWHYSAECSTNSKSAQGLVGLKNLGNTCFMNSILQCLSNTHSLRDYCLHNSHRRDLNNNSRTNTALMEEFAKLLQTMWTSSSSEAVSPSEFKTQIQRYAPRFVGYNQQDAQEFLRFLLDGLHNEVNRVTVRPRGSVEDFDHLPDEEKGKKMWNKYLEREDSKIVDVFVGQLKSSLTCSHCGFCSTVFDPFWDLSLPIAK
ncbi:hypothetical protein JOQ06_016674, partial [Pogonophryne albipinna]